MSLLSAAQLTKIAALTVALAEARGGGKQVEVCELVAADWPAPDARVFYASTFADDIWPGLRALIGDAAIEPRLQGSQFLEVLRDSGIADDSVPLDLWDADRAISALFETHGEGVRVEIYFYFPAFDLLLSMWHGHFRPPDSADEERFKAQAENGFMSVQLSLPRRAFYNTCQAAVFGGRFATQAEIDEHDCDYNRQIVGGTRGNLDSATGLPYTSCPKNTRAACIARLGDDLSYLAFDTLVSSHTVGSRGVIATSRGNENNLKRPLRVLAGERTVRNLDLLQYVVEIGNPKHPEAGSISLLYAVSEGRLRSLGQPKVNNVPVQPQHYATRLGWARQPAVGFVGGAHNYPKTALLHVVLQGDFSKVDPTGIQTEIGAQGNDDVRVYTAETTFTAAYTNSRAWWLLETLRHKRWGLGGDVVRFAIEADFIPLAAWFAEEVSFRAPDGTGTTGPRSTFKGELLDRTAQQQINDICLAGRCTVPFPYQGKLRVMPLTKLTADELLAAPVFTDYDSSFERNIIRDDSTHKSSLTRAIKSDRELPNRIVVTFDDAAHNYEEHPRVVEDEDQQRAAGRAFGDTGRRVVEKPYGLLGVTAQGEADRCAELLLRLGEFDEGGIENNLRITFQTFFTHALELYKSKVIRVLAKQLINPRTGVQKFAYFRIRSVRQLPNLLVEISAQAYPVEYYALTENLVVPVGAGGGDLITNPGGGRGARPRDVLAGSVDTTPDAIIIHMARAL